MEPSCLLGLGNSHLLLELRAEGLQIRLEKPDITPHHAEMGNLLSLYPKIHCLAADTQVRSCLANRQRKFLREYREGRTCGGCKVWGDVLWTHEVISCYYAGS